MRVKMKDGSEKEITIKTDFDYFTMQRVWDECMVYNEETKKYTLDKMGTFAIWALEICVSGADPKKISYKSQSEVVAEVMNKFLEQAKSGSEEGVLENSKDGEIGQQ